MFDLQPPEKAADGGRRFNLRATTLPAGSGCARFRDVMRDVPRRWWRRLREKGEPKLLGAALAVVLASLGFVGLIDEVLEGETRAIDRGIVRYVHEQWVGSAQSPVAEVAADLTALGGMPVLVVVTAAVVGYLLLRRAIGRALYTALATVSGSAVAFGLKYFLARPRPTVVEPLDVVETASLPSGHAMSSAVVYLTLALLLAAGESKRVLQIYVVGVAVGLSGLVGLTRIALAVHYPTDVLAGWLAGLAWALGCWIIYAIGGGR